MPPREDGLGLSGVDSDALRKLLRAVHRGDAPCPLTPIGLASVGLQDQVGPILSHMRGLSRSGVHAVLVAVLAERG